MAAGRKELFDPESTQLTLLDDATREMVAVSGEAAARRHVLAMLEGPGAPARYVLRDGSTVLGRSSDNEIVIPSGDLSRRHVRLALRDGEVSCLDLGSLHGLFVNGIKAHSAVLRDGDLLKLGSVVLVYRVERG